MKQFLDPLKPTGTHSLKLCSSLLHRRSPEPVLSEEVASDLRGRVHALISEVLAADDLDRETKSWVVERLSGVERALRDVEVRGHRGVEDSVDRLVGGLRRKPQLLQRLGASKAVQAVVVTVTAPVTVDLGPPTSSVEPDQAPAYEQGSRMLVSGEPRWGGEPLEDAMAWSCGGFTRYDEEAVADEWRRGTA